MLISSCGVSENIVHVIYPLASECSRKILSMLGLLEYMENHIYINSDFHGPSRSWKDQISRRAILDEEKFEVNIKFNNNTTGLKWDVTSPGQHLDPAVHRRDTMSVEPLFYDPATGIHVIERYMPCNIEMECALSFTDSVAAYDTVVNMTNTFNRGELMLLTNFSYDYQFPLPILKDLYQLGRMKGIGKGKFMDWFKACSKNQLQLLKAKNPDNPRHELVVHKEMYEVLASIDYNPDQPATKAEDKQPVLITLNFNVTLQFGRVNMLYLKYPIVVNNTLVPESLVHVPKDEAYGRLIRLLRHPYLYLDPMYQENKMLYKLPVRNPWYDNWQLPTYSQHKSVTFRTDPFFIGVLTLDNEKCNCCHEEECICECDNKYTVIDLYEDLDQFKLTNKVLEYFAKHKEKCLDVASEFNVTVFADNTQVHPNVLKFDGRYLKIPNNINSKQVIRLVLGKTPDRLAGVNPWFFILDCIVEVGHETK